VALIREETLEIVKGESARQLMVCEKDWTRGDASNWKLDALEPSKDTQQDRNWALPCLIVGSNLGDRPMTNWQYRTVKPSSKRQCNAWIFAWTTRKFLFSLREEKKTTTTAPQCKAGFPVSTVNSSFSAIESFGYRFQLILSRQVEDSFSL